MTDLQHTRTGWWLEEATAVFGSVQPEPPLANDTTADVLVVGGGYLGMWTAWHLKELEPEARVVLVDASLCGHGPSGRNGGFVSTLWDDLPTLRERVGDTRAVDVCRASERAVRGIGTWCETSGVDAWYVTAPTMNVATSDAQVGDWNDLVEACRAVGAPEQAVVIDEAEVLRRCASPLFRGGGMLLTLAANVQPARLSLGLRRGSSRAGYASTSAPVCAGWAEMQWPPPTAGRSAHGQLCLRSTPPRQASRATGCALAVASSHIVLTEPVPDMLEQLGWTGGEAVCDSRTMLHYLRTTRDGRIAFGWGGGRMGFGGRSLDRLELDAGVTGRVQDDLVQFFPELRDRAVTHAWGGPIDVSPTHLPIFGSRGAVHHGYGFTGNGVGPSYLGGEILARLALDRSRRADETRHRRARPQALPTRAAAVGRRIADPGSARPPRSGRRRGPSRRPAHLAGRLDAATSRPAPAALTVAANGRRSYAGRLRPEPSPRRSPSASCASERARLPGDPVADTLGDPHGLPQPPPNGMRWTELMSFSTKSLGELGPVERLHELVDDALDQIAVCVPRVLSPRPPVERRPRPPDELERRPVVDVLRPLGHDIVERHAED